MIMRPMAGGLRLARPWPSANGVLPVVTVAGIGLVTWLALLTEVLTSTTALVVAISVVAMIRPKALVIGMVPLCAFWHLLPGGWTVVLDASAALLVSLSLRVVHGSHRLRWPHLLVLAFAAVLTASALLPQLDLPVRVSVLAGLLSALVGLTVLGTAFAFDPQPLRVAAAIALTGTAAALSVTSGGTYANGRLSGLDLNPNYLGAMLALSLTAALGLAWHRRRPLWLLAAAPCAYTLVLTDSRGALLAVVAGVVTIVLGVGSKRGARLAAFGLGTVIMMVLQFGGTGALSGRSMQNLDRNNDLRTVLAKGALQVAADYPVRGIGLGMFPAYARNIPSIGIPLNTHNDYLRLAAEAGLGALVLFLALLWLGIRDRQGGELAVLRAVVVAGAVGLAFANTLSTVTVSVPFWLALGCLLAARISKPSLTGTVRSGGVRSELPASCR